MANLDWYNKFAPCPKDAQRTIQAGKLKGKTDINPQWRIQTLTGHFGPVGFGWYTEIVKYWTEESDGEVAAFVICNLYVKDPTTNEWSQPIVGMGGSKLCGKGKGDGIDDEAFKMAETDAISVCCKKLGLAADIYWQKTAETKYGKADTQQPAPGSNRPIRVHADFTDGGAQPLFD